MTDLTDINIRNFEDSSYTICYLKDKNWRINVKRSKDSYKMCW